MARDEADTQSAPLEASVGRAVKRDRQLKGLTLAELSDASGVSTAMISKIERGQVSASLTVLEAIARAIDVPLVNFLADTAEQTDISHVHAGAGMWVKREGAAFDQIFRQIGRARADGMRMRAHLIELDDPARGEPLLSHPGVEFIHIIEGAMLYRCGKSQYELRKGDSLTFETRTPHRPEKLLTPKVTLLSVTAEPHLDE